MADRIYGAGDLAEVNRLLHDCWLDIDRLRHRAEEFEVPLTSSPKSKAKVEDFSRTLRITPVVSVDLEDVEEVGFYDLDFLELAPGQDILRFHCNIPLKLDLRLGSTPLRVTFEVERR